MTDQTARRSRSWGELVEREIERLATQLGLLLLCPLLTHLRVQALGEIGEETRRVLQQPVLFAQFPQFGFDYPEHSSTLAAANDLDARMTMSAARTDCSSHAHTVSNKTAG